MQKSKVALIALASHDESGGERGEIIVQNAKKNLEQRGLEVVKTNPKIVWDACDALKVVDQLSKTKPDLVVLIHITWVCDSLQYIFVNNMKCPVVLWAIPYAETFSIGCVQHFGSVLWEHNISYKYVYGLPEDKELISKICNFVNVANVYKNLKKTKVALIGPTRQTWRVAGSQDMTSEEWEFSKKFGITIIHIDIDELLSNAENQKIEDAKEVIQNMKSKKRLGKVEVDEECLIYQAKVYLGIKELFRKYSLTAATAECYPRYGGLVNLPSSWLADEGLVLDTEGDIGHTTLMVILNQLSLGPTALAEAGEVKGNCIYLAHEGSSAHSLAEDVTKVHILPGGEKGTVVGVPFKAMPEVTMTDICGRENSYRMLVAKGSTEHVTEEEWIKGGRKFFAKVNLGDETLKKFEKMLSEGVDHHLLLKEGDLTSQLSDLCDILSIKKIIL